MVCSAWRRLRGDLIAVYNFLMRRRGEADADLSSVMISDGSQGALEQAGTGEVVMLPSLCEFKKCLDNKIQVCGVILEVS